MSGSQNNDGGGIFEVEYIVEASRAESGGWVYLTKWWGYDESNNTWEPESNMDSCAELLDGFWNHVGRERKNLKKSKPIRSSRHWREEQTERTRALKENEEREDGKRASSNRDSSTDGEMPSTSDSNLSRSVQDYDSEPFKSKDKSKQISADGTKKKDKETSVSKGTGTSSSKSTPSGVRPLKRRRAISDSDSSASSKAANLSSLSSDGGTSESEVSSSLLRRKSAHTKRLRLDSSDDEGPHETPKTVATALSATAETAPSGSATNAPPVNVPIAPSMPSPEPVANPPSRPAISVPTNRTPPVPSRRRDSGSSSDETPLSVTASKPVLPTLHGKTILKPIEPIVDKHRGSRVKLMPTPVTQASSLSTKLSAAGGSVARAFSQLKNPVVSTANLRRVQPGGQAPPSDEILANPSDPPLGLKAHDQIVPLSLGELSPVLNTSSTAKPKPPGRRGAVDVTEALSKMPSNYTSAPPKSEPTPIPVPSPVTKEPTMKMTKKWVGSLVLGGSTYCQITLETLSTSAADKVMPIILASLEGRLQASATFPAAGIAHLFLPAFNLPVEFARVAPADSDNANRLERLLTYMELEHQISIFQSGPKFPMMYFVLHPSTLAEATFALGTPKAIQNGPPTLALVMLEKRRERDFMSHNLVQSFPPTPAVHLPGDVDIPSYQRIARYFGFTKRLLDYLSGRTFCVFPAHGERSSMPISDNLFDDPETAALALLLTKCGGRRVDWRDKSNSIVFIHSNAWLSSKIPAPDPLLNRSKSYLIQYFKYGTSLNCLPGENRHVCEAFPLGGVVSLTARAMVDDPDGIFSLIDRVGSHPLWQLYLMPETLGLLSHALTDAEVSSGAVVAIGGLLARLQRSEINLAISSCPPQLSSESSSVDSILSWKEMQSSLADLYNNPPALLDYCATRLRTTYAPLVNAAFAQLEAAVESDCIRDLENLQRQPALYTRHREFVLIVPDRGVSGSDPSKHHAVAIHTLGGFVFIDANPLTVDSLSYD